jgi:hypothetical protein
VVLVRDGGTWLDRAFGFPFKMPEVLIQVLHGVGTVLELDREVFSEAGGIPKVKVYCHENKMLKRSAKVTECWHFEKLWESTAQCSTFVRMVVP